MQKRIVMQLGRSVRRPQIRFSTCGAQYTTYQNQKNIPALPVANLEESCEVYLRTLLPLATPQQLENSKKNVKQFLENEGPVLYQRLLKYAEERNSKGESWLESLWYKAAYLSYRDALPTNSNYYFLFDKHDAETPQVKKAAQYIATSLEFWDLIKQEKVQPEYLRKNQPQCMDQFKQIFNVTRVAIPDVDELVRIEGSKYILIICNNQYFTLQVLDDNFVAFNVNEIERQLQQIKSIATSTNVSHPPVGAITSINRDESAKVRAALAKDNAAVLHEIDHALFAVTLDLDSPANRDQAGEWLNAGNKGTIGNRWFEKFVNFVVFENGWAGLSGEHTPLDAPIVGTLTDYILERINNNQIPNTPLRSTPNFKSLTWKLDDNVKSLLAEAEKGAIFVLENAELRFLHYREYGADWIKANAKMSPDAYAQMGIQLAYYLVHRECTATYETGTARCFYHGRTETVRSCSIDSLEWTRAMVDSSVSREEKLQKLQKAINSHSDYMKRAVDGKGIDRVFLGIRSVRKPDEPMPAMFTDPLWRESTRFRVSTSNVPSKNFIAGFGPTEPDGYGICYATRADVLQFSVCSLRNCSKTNTQQFRDSLSSALDLMRSLFKETSKL